MLHAPFDPKASVTFTDPSLLMCMGEQRHMRKLTPTSQGLRTAAVGRLPCLILLVLCVMISACTTHEGYTPGCEVQDGASLSLTIISRLPESKKHFLCFLLRGQHEISLRLVSLSIRGFFCVCRVEDHAFTALLGDGAQSLAYANQVLDC